MRAQLLLTLLWGALPAVSVAQDMRLTVAPTVDHRAGQSGDVAGGGASASYGLQFSALTVSVDAGFRLWHTFDRTAGTGSAATGQPAAAFSPGFVGGGHLAVGTMGSGHGFEATLLDFRAVVAPPFVDQNLHYEANLAWVINQPNIAFELALGYHLETRRVIYEDVHVVEELFQHATFGAALHVGRLASAEAHRRLSRWWFIVGYRAEFGPTTQEQTDRPMVVHARVTVPLWTNIYLYASLDGTLRRALPPVLYSPRGGTQHHEFGPPFSVSLRRWTHHAQLGVQFDLL